MALIPALPYRPLLSCVPLVSFRNSFVCEGVLLISLRFWFCVSLMLGSTLCAVPVELSSFVFIRGGVLLSRSRDVTLFSCVKPFKVYR